MNNTDLENKMDKSFFLIIFFNDAGDHRYLDSSKVNRKSLLNPFIVAILQRGFEKKMVASNTNNPLCDSNNVEIYKSKNQKG